MENQPAPSDLDRERLFSDSRVREFFGGVSPMTIWRWERNETLGFPLAVVINGRKFRRVGDMLDFRDRHRRAAPVPSIQECHNSATHVFGSARSVNGPRRQRQAAHLHSLGPRPTLEAFLEVADGRDLDDVLGRYARLAANLSGSGQAEAARNLSGQNAGVAAHRLARRSIVDGT